MVDSEIAQCLLQAGKPELAQATCETVLAQFPDYAAAKNLCDRARSKLAVAGDRTENGHPWLNHAKQLEQAGDYAGAWQTITAAKEELKERGYFYEADKVTERFDRFSAWCTAEKMQRLSTVRPIMRRDEIKPVFVLGYPRSGTTLMEQILSSHPDVAGGGELPFLQETAYTAPRLLASRLPYPDCLDELLLADSAIAVTMLREFYLARVAERFPGVAGYVTDKMPLNETHLPLLHLIFPDAPKILMRRDPLDVLISNFSLFLTHGSHQACDPQSCWHHICLTHGLVEHYRAQMPGLKLMVIQYENLVQSPEFIVRQAAAFSGLTFDPAMLHPESNPRYCHTASFSQVREAINTKGVGRWRRYEAQLREAIPEAFV